MSAKACKSEISREAGAALCCAVFVFIGATSALCESLPTHHVRQAVASGEAQFLYPMPPTETLRINILLPVRDQAGLDEFLREVYDPSSPIYRQFLTVPEFTERFGPTQKDYDAVAQFARANGMTVVKEFPNRLALGVTASAASIERAFHVKMGVYQHPTENRTFFAPDREPTVDLSISLWHIGGLDSYSTPHPLYLKAAPGTQANTTGSGPGGNFLGSDRRAAYYGQTALTGSGQSVGLFQLDGYTTSDVQAYFTNVGQTLNVPINNVLVDGASAGSDGDDTEQVIDIIESVSMAPALSQVLMYIGPGGFSFIDGVTDYDIFSKMATDNVAKKLSCSWTWKPADPGSPGQPGTDDFVLAELGLQGQNLFVASGDHGSFPNSSGFYYPAEDAYVTGVGGTTLTTNGAGGPWQSEVAWGTNNTTCSGNASSGGGISPDHIPIPSYQQLSGVINSSNGGSTVYRNVPDVAVEANCDNYYCANGSCGTGLGGTSLAAPTWAGYLALANQQYLANGHTGTLGFINASNPGLYHIGVGINYKADLIDITSGTNGGFSAVPGYDLVTGWGSPNGCNLADGLTGSSSCPVPAASAPTSLTITSSYGLPATGTATLTNNGPGTLAILSLVVTGNGFSLSSTSCATYVPQGTSCNANVTFDPGGSCLQSTGQLVFYDDGTNGEQTVNLTGKSVKCPPAPAK